MAVKKSIDVGCPGLERVGEKREKESDAEMQRTHLGIVEDEDVERERQRRRVPELQQRPADAGRRQYPGRNPDRLAPAEIGLVNELPDVDAGFRHLIQPFSR